MAEARSLGARLVRAGIQCPTCRLCSSGGGSARTNEPRTHVQQRMGRQSVLLLQSWLPHDPPSALITHQQTFQCLHCTHALPTLARLPCKQPHPAACAARASTDSYKPRSHSVAMSYQLSMSDSILPPNPAAPLLPQIILDASEAASSTITPSPPPPVVDPSTLSSRGRRACQPIAPYFSRFLAALEDQWSESNPDGYVLLCVAENKLNWQMWADKAHTHRQLAPDAGAYSDFSGRPALRQQLARLMNRRLSSPAEPVVIQPEQICIGNGVGPTLATLVALLCEPGDGILIPAPLYAAFPNDLSILAGAIPVPVRTEQSEYRLTVDAFEAARHKFDTLASRMHAAQPHIDAHYFDKDKTTRQTADGQRERAVAQQTTGITIDDEDTNSIRLYQQQLELTHNANNRIRAVLLTNPHNPLGLVKEREEMEAVMAWAAEKGLHVIVDEIYANSIFDPLPLPQYSSHDAVEAAADISPSPFYSALHYLSASTPAATKLQLPLTHLHVLHGLSKDFALSGYRVGWLVTGSDAVRRAWGNIGYFTGVSNDVQCLVESVLHDEDWVDEYLFRNCELLAANYATLSRLLDGSHDSLADQYASGEDDPSFTVPHVPAYAGMFAFVDLRQFLSLLPDDTATTAANVWLREERLFDVLMDEARVVLTPGHSQMASEPGWFRLCFGWMGESALVAGMKRMRRVLYKRRYGDSGAVLSGGEVVGVVDGGKGAKGEILTSEDKAE